MDSARIQFAHRLNELCDEKDVPPKHHARQIKLGELFDVSANGARKWLEGESTPQYETCVRIAQWGDINFEWLMTGRGLKRSSDLYPTKAIEHVALLMQAMEPEQQHLTVRLIDSLAEPKEGTNDH